MILRFILLIFLLPFVNGDIAYFSSDDYYNSYEFDNKNFENEQNTSSSYFFTDYNNYFEFENFNNIYYGRSYYLYGKDNNFYVIKGKMRVNTFDSSTGSNGGLMVFYNPAISNNNHIKIEVHDNISLYVSVVGGYVICTKCYTKEYNINEWFNYKIYVKNETNKIDLSLVTWGINEEEPQNYYRNYTIQGASRSQYGTFGVYGRNVSIDYQHLNVSGYTVYNDRVTTDILNFNESFITILLITMYPLMLLLSILTSNKSVFLLNSIYGVIIGLIYITDYFFISMVFIALNTVLIYAGIKE